MLMGYFVKTDLRFSMNTGQMVDGGALLRLKGLSDNPCVILNDIYLA